MNAHTDIWRDEHARFRRLLDLLEANIGLLSGGAQPNYGLMLDILHYLQHYPEHFHYPKENAAIVRLTGREPRRAALLLWLRCDHEVIERIGARLLEQLEAIGAEAMVSRGAVQAAAATYVAHYRLHLAREEHELFPRIQRLFGKADWAAIEGAGLVRRDPLFGEHVEKRYQQLHRHIAFESGCGCTTPNLKVGRRLKQRGHTSPLSPP